ncbi:tetratricopeptide repeat protein [Pseudomonas sp. Gutcm_11s]|uniref:tetratricopeptide repeat protein n=1 Tax=Pseudomonas sp. Gutcm_11s TaxID=3026088 RepID=UPI00235F8706|nr:tetratricopeptide repeat protein [Pseudomonas sp. Gutcm_11s]MDD0842154.1 tetratricopeptide repeat protein [Pseudomonas sp. Gutcm_11s]
MSLVNDMLRDLEERRAAPTERLALEGLHAVDEVGANRRERIERLRRGSIWFLAVMLIATLIGVMIGRVVNGQIPWGGVMPKPQQPVAAAPLVAQPRLLEVLPQNDSRGLTLQLLLERSVPYQRTEESGAVSLRLPGVALVGGPQASRVQRNGRSLSWRVEAQGEDVQVLLVGLGEGLEVRDRLEPVGDRWMLWIEVPLNEPVAAIEPSLELDQLPAAAPAEERAAEPEMPAWATAPVPAARVAEPSAPAVQPEPVSGPPEVKIQPYRPDGLAEARQAIQAGDYRKAISELETLQKTRSQDPEVMRWLARAYLGDGQQARLLGWLPEQLAKTPQDSELRLLLARAQLQAGDTMGAVATLEQNAPALAQEPTYHALLAASYQQTGQWQQSAALYRQMVALRPSQATWQLGLAIAMEQLDQPGEAARHYRLALQGLGLDESARRFASERVSALGGRG